jgi:uncharacterized alkaline shock family protein YloU
MLDLHWDSYHRLSFTEALQKPIYLYAFLLLLILLLFFVVIRKLRKELIEVFSDEEGHVQITPNALHEIVKQSCDELTGVNCPDTEIKRKGKCFRLNIKIRVKKNCNIKETRQNLQKRIESIMVENLSFTNFQGLDITIKGFED